VTRLQQTVTEAIAKSVTWTYDKIAVRKDTVFENAVRHYELPFDEWRQYQKDASFRVMDEIANGYILQCKVQVIGLGALMGPGGFATIVPDAVQFLGFTLRMVTGIAAAYGFDPDPKFLEGRTKAVILQAYLNANIGKGAAEAGGKIGAGVAFKFFKNVAMRSNALAVLVVSIGKVLGIRITRQWLLRSIPFVASAANAGINWYLARAIGEEVRTEFRQFRKDLRAGKYGDDSDYDDL
jgi:hypothetical protein